MSIFRTFRYPLYPSALEESALVQQKQLAELRQNDPEFGDISSSILRSAIFRLDSELVVSLFSRYDLISYEKLNISRMVHGNLAKSIHDAAWGLFIHSLNCKAEEAGKWAIGVDPRGTSQRCSRCGKVPEVRKTLADRVHYCDCGPPMDRDFNAACNIDALGLSALEAAWKNGGEREASTGAGP